MFTIRGKFTPRRGKCFLPPSNPDIISSQFVGYEGRERTDSPDQESAGAEDRGPDVPLRGAGRPARGARLCEGSAGVSTAGEGDGQEKIEELITRNAHLELEFKH